MSPTIPNLTSPPSIQAFGGTEGLYAILSDFYDRVFADPMISYLFRGQDKKRLIDREFEWTAQALGLEIEYKGKSIAKAHQAHPIRKGHFFRRNQLLKETLIDKQLSDEVIQWWMQHSAALEQAILGKARFSKACEETANGQEAGHDQAGVFVSQPQVSSERAPTPVSLWRKP